MKVEIIVDDKAEDLHVVVTCKHLTPDIEKLLGTLRMMDRQLTAMKNGEIYLLDIAEVIYIESIDRKCFVYTSKEVYESDFRLYELDTLSRIRDKEPFSKNRSRIPCGIKRF